MKCTQLLLIFLCTCSLTSIAQSDYTLVMDRIREDELSAAGNITTLDNNVTTTLGSLNTNGSWPDISYTYSSTTYQASTHINRVKSFALAYSHTSSSYYHSDTLFDAITRSLDYWDTRDPISWNWWHNEISNPKAIGQILIILETAPDTLPSTLRSNLLSQMNRGNPSVQTGTNKLDVAIHFIYRACLTANATLMNTGVSEAFQPIVITTGDGIQPDLSFQQHGPQFYLYGYGDEFVKGEVDVAYYLRGTAWALSGSKHELFSNFMRKAFLKVLRYKYTDFSTCGRGISRPGNLNRANTGPIKKWMELDTAYTAEYEAIRARHLGYQPPSYMVEPFHSHFWHSDYSVHQRPGYFFGLRNVSTRTAKSEYGNGENLKGYYLTEGATCIMTKGTEYVDIFPVWDWTRIPGTTVPVLTTIPLHDKEWGNNKGGTPHTGGVSDSVYGATILAMNDYSTLARKGWFCFDDEVVCLGGYIKSTAPQAINTTVNQCLLNGDVTVFADGSQSTLSSGSHTFNNTLKWVEHDSVGYYFPSGGNIHLTNQAQSGTWKSIKDNASTTLQTKNVFKLWFDHGVAPTNGSYVYYIVPGKNRATYDTTQIRVQYNNMNIQAVRHVGLNIWYMVFYAAGTFSQDSVTVTVDRACTIMLKDVGTTDVTMSIASQTQSTSPVNISFNLPNIPYTRQLSCAMPSGNFAGSTVVYHVNLSTPTDGTAGSVSPIADSYVQNGALYEDLNYGTATSMVVKTGSPGYTREAYLKFDLSGLPSDATRVKLRMYVDYANTDIADISWITQYVSNDSWTETGITWNNKPAAVSNIDTLPGMAAGNYAEWDVTAIALAQKAADGVLTLRVVTDVFGSKTDVRFPSREAANELQRPVLEYTTGDSLGLVSAKGYVSGNPVPLSALINETTYPGTKVYPVPAGNSVRVQTDRVYDRAELRDGAGHIIKREVLEGRQQFSIDLQRLPPGLYFLQLSGPGGNEIRKVIKL